MTASSSCLVAPDVMLTWFAVVRDSGAWWCFVGCERASVALLTL